MLLPNHDKGIQACTFDFVGAFLCLYGIGPIMANNLGTDSNLTYYLFYTLRISARLALSSYGSVFV